MKKIAISVAIVMLLGSLLALNIASSEITIPWWCRLFPNRPVCSTPTPIPIVTRTPIPIPTNTMTVTLIPTATHTLTLIPTIQPTSTQIATLANPFGLMLQAPGMSIGERITMVQELGAIYFRPNSVFLDRWDGSCEECRSAEDAGLIVVLTIRANVGPLNPTDPPTDLETYRQILEEVIGQNPPLILAVENEENSTTFYSVDPIQYAEELEVACQVSHVYAVPCTNGGMVSKLVALLVWNSYIEEGDISAADSFRQRVFTPEEQAQLDSANVQGQIVKGKQLLDVYRDGPNDFVNIHWYIPDTLAFSEAVEFMSHKTGKQVITNEIGQQDLFPQTVTGLMGAVVDLQIPYAVWFSIDGPKAYALMNDDGSLRPGGIAFQEFTLEQWPR